MDANLDRYSIKTVSDKIKNIKEFEEKEGAVEATKINGKWNIIMNNLK